MRNESFRIARLKSLISLGALNQPFRGFLRYQRLGADFVSQHSRLAPLLDIQKPKVLTSGNQHTGLQPASQDIVGFSRLRPLGERLFIAWGPRRDRIRRIP
jgi:hypothetical protein